MVAYTFIFSTQEWVELCEFKANPVYRLSSRIARTTQILYICSIYEVYWEILESVFHIRLGWEPNPTGMFMLCCEFNISKRGQIIASSWFVILNITSVS